MGPTGRFTRSASTLSIYARNPSNALHRCEGSLPGEKLPLRARVRIATRQEDRRQPREKAPRLHGIAADLVAHSLSRMPSLVARGTSTVGTSRWRWMLCVGAQVVRVIFRLSIAVRNDIMWLMASVRRGRLLRNPHPRNPFQM